MARGLIQGALQGLGESMQQFGNEALKMEIMSIRDQRLAELQAQRDDKLMSHQTALADKQIAAHASESALGRDHQTALQATSLEHAARLASQAQAHMSSEAAAGRVHATGEAAATRQLQRDLADKQERAANARHGASMAVQQKQVDILAKGAELDREIKQIQVKNLQRVDTLQNEFRTTTDPARKSAIKDEIQVLTGKDNDNFIPVPIKDETGAITGYQIFDKKSGKFADGKSTDPARATGAKWDSGTGEVLLDGRVLGKASNETEARKLLSDARSAASKTPKTPAPKPLASTEPRGLGAVLDAQRPYQRPAREEESGEPMLFP